jgi:hypothetical protein
VVSGQFSVRSQSRGHFSAIEIAERIRQWTLAEEPAAKGSRCVKRIMLHAAENGTF